MEISNEIWVAIVGVIGVILTALLSNWEKLFPDKGQIIVRVSGYRPTNNYETELRYFFEVSGARTLIENTTLQILKNMEAETLIQYPEDKDEIRSMFQTIMDEVVTVDDAIKKLLPVYERHYTLEQIQELNRFYSTDIMQQMANKSHAIAIEAAPLQLELIKENQEKIDRLINSEFGEKGETELSK